MPKLLCRVKLATHIGLVLGSLVWGTISSAATIEDVHRAYEWIDLNSCKRPVAKLVTLPEKIQDSVEYTTDVGSAQIDLDGSGNCISVTSRTFLFGRPDGFRQLQIVKRYFRFENGQWREFDMEYGVGQPGERFFDYDVYAIRERKTGLRIFIVPQSYETFSMSIQHPTQLPMAFTAQGWAKVKNTSLSQQEGDFIHVFQFFPNKSGTVFQALAVFLTERLKSVVGLKDVLTMAEFKAKGIEEMDYYGPNQGPIIGLMKKARETLNSEQLVQVNRYGLPVSTPISRTHPSSPP